MSCRNIRRDIKNITTQHYLYPHKTHISVSLVIDTTYFNTYGVMVWRCFKRKRNLLWKFVIEETVLEYIQGIKHLEEQGYVIDSITCDGQKWLIQGLVRLGYNVQMCHFHIMKTVTKYLTKRPVLDAGRELRNIMLAIPKIKKEDFNLIINNWYIKWELFLKDRTTDPITHKWCYTHRRIRSAYRAIRTFLPYLFTYQDYPYLNIPNTTNTLDGTFSHLKQKVHIHRGLNINIQKKMISSLLNKHAKGDN